MKVATTAKEINSVKKDIREINKALKVQQTAEFKAKYTPEQQKYSTDKFLTALNRKKAYLKELTGEK